MDIDAYDLTKVKKVKMSQVHANTWNPKEKNHEKLEVIEESIRKHGFKQPVQVRNHPTKDGEYEIVDGEQRYTAMDNLGAEYIFIYDNGDISDDDAQNETLWWQIQVPFEPVGLAKMVTTLQAKGMQLPYTPKEIEKIKDGAVMKDPASDNENNTTIKFTADQYHTIMNAVEIAVENAGEDMKPGRAIELICADYISGN